MNGGFSHIRCLGIVEQVWERVVVLFGFVAFAFCFFKPTVCVGVCVCGCVWVFVCVCVFKDIYFGGATF